MKTFINKLRREALTILLLASFLGACSSSEPVAADAQGISFVHLNDTYRIASVESGTAGGFGRVVSVVRAIQAEGREVRVLHGGDFLYPSLESQLWNGEQMVHALNFIDGVAPLYMTAGNHEFDRRTPGPLINAVRLSTFDWLGDNYRFATGDAEVDAALKAAFVTEIAGRRVGFFSLTLHGDDGGNHRDYVPIEPDYFAVASRVIESLDTAGVDLIVGLTHIHFWQDQKIAALKASYPKLKFIVGAHEHEPHYAAPTPGSAAVMKGASNAREIWRVDIDFDAAGNAVLSSTTRILLDESIAEDADYMQLADSWRSRLLDKFPFLEARVGEAAVRLDARESTIRSRESSWGNFIVDQMRRAFGDTPSDIAFINSGSIRIDDYIDGDITFEDIGRTFGFSSFLRHLTISGAEFRDLMEAGFRGDGASQGYFPQVSGFRVCVDPARPEFQRIVSLQLPGEGGWQEIDPLATYTLVMPDFLYGGGDGYQVPAGREASLAGSELKYLVLDGIMAAQARGEKVGKAVDPANPRIVILDSAARSACF
jgi:5'-nucleotidase